MHYSKQVVLVTGSSRGLGKAFAQHLGQAGAQVVVNSTGSSEQGNQVAAAIVEAGGRAVHIPGRVEDAAQLISTVLDTCGRIDAVVHNAGFVRDKTLRKMSSQQWDEVLDVHLKSAFLLSQAAWPYFAEHGGGRLVFLSSAAGLYGNFGQANYAAAKVAMYGLCRSIALEGASQNIKANCVAPFGATELNSGNMPDEFKAIIKTDYVAPLISYLAHPECNESGSMFEASAGSFKKVRWERSQGVRLDTQQPLTLDDIAANWARITSFAQSEHPEDMREALRGMYEQPID